MASGWDYSEERDLERRLIEHVLGCEALMHVMSAAEELKIRIGTSLRAHWRSLWGTLPSGALSLPT